MGGDVSITLSDSLPNAALHRLRQPQENMENRIAARASELLAEMTGDDEYGAIANQQDPTETQSDEARH